MIQRRVTVLCLMSYSPRVAHAHNARIPSLNELRRGSAKSAKIEIFHSSLIYSTLRNII